MRHPLVLALSLAILLPAAAHAGFLKGPYLQDVSQEGIAVCWQTESTGSGQVLYGETSALGDTQATASEADFQQVHLTGLKPGTEYWYQVLADGETSDLKSFVTAPLPEAPFSFVVVGDTRTDDAAHQTVIDRILYTVGPPDLFLNTGDLVEDGDAADLWGEFFDIEGLIMASAPLYPVAGNHDDVGEDSFYVQFFDLPSSTSATENWYAFTYGNTRFVVADTNEDFVTGSEQHRWLESELSAAAADPAIRHTMVAFHHPPYSSGAHGVFDPDEWQAARTYLVPLFEEYGVDIVFNGHDHHYERTDPDQTGGVLYLVCGGGGAPGAPEDFVEGLDSVVGYLGMDPNETVGQYIEANAWLVPILSLFVDGPDQYENGWWRARAEVVKHFIQVQVAGGYVEGNVYTEDGQLLDHWTVGTYDASEVDDDGDGWTEQEGDCDDVDPAVNPDAVDDDCDGDDEDCDGIDGGCDDDPSDDSGTGPDDEPDPDDGADGGDVQGSPGGCSCASRSGPGPCFLGLLTLGLALRRRR